MKLKSGKKQRKPMKQNAGSLKKKKIDTLLETLTKTKKTRYKSPISGIKWAITTDLATTKS